MKTMSFGAIITLHIIIMKTVIIKQVQDNLKNNLSFSNRQNFK
jgi:hypothetical protein